MFWSRFGFYLFPTAFFLRALLWQPPKIFLKSIFISKSSGNPTHSNILRHILVFSFLRGFLSLLLELCGTSCFINWIFEFCLSLPPPLSLRHVEFIEILIVCLSQALGYGVQSFNELYLGLTVIYLYPTWFILVLGLHRHKQAQIFSSLWTAYHFKTQYGGI